MFFNFFIYYKLPPGGQLTCCSGGGVVGCDLAYLNKTNKQSLNNKNYMQILPKGEGLGEARVVIAHNISDKVTNPPLELQNVMKNFNSKYQ